MHRSTLVFQLVASAVFLHDQMFSLRSTILRHPPFNELLVGEQLIAYGMPTNKRYAMHYSLSWYHSCRLGTAYCTPVGEHWPSGQCIARRWFLSQR